MSRAPSQFLGAAAIGAMIGGFGGYALGSSFGGQGGALGAVLGAFIIGIGEGFTDAYRVPGQPKPLPQRIASGAAIAAGVGWLFDLVLSDVNLVVFGASFGVVLGALGFRWQKIVLGGAVGLAIGLVLEGSWPEAGLSWLAALTLLVYRSAAAWVYRGREQIAIVGEQVPAADLEFVVPFAARNRYVGVDYLREYADLTGADFVRNPTDVGIVANFDDLAGPEFDPTDVHPLIREFYEHTSRFHLAITPEWRWWMRPPYLVYRSLIAVPFGQANPPFDVAEVQEGVVSWIDTIDLDHTGQVDFRAWVRAYEASSQPIYVGIYTVLRHNDIGYVSVGFPLPEGNFTATLLPHTNRADGLLLKSNTARSYTGHYLSAVEQETSALTTLQLRNFDEEIDVYVEDGELRTDHRFYLNRIRFLTLHYSIERESKVF